MKIWQKYMRDTPPETGREEAVFWFIFLFYYHRDRNCSWILWFQKPQAIIPDTQGWMTTFSLQPHLTSGATFLWWCLFQGSVCSWKLQFLSLFEVLNMVPEQGKLVRSLVLQKHVLDGLFGQCAGSWRGGGQSYWVWTWVLCQRLLWDIVGPLSYFKRLLEKGRRGERKHGKSEAASFPLQSLKCWGCWI